MSDEFGILLALAAIMAPLVLAWLLVARVGQRHDGSRVPKKKK